MSFDPVPYEATTRQPWTRMPAGIDDGEPSAVGAEIEPELAQFETDDGFVESREMLVASAAK